MNMDALPNRMEPQGGSRQKQKRKGLLWIAAVAAVLAVLLFVLHQLGYFRFPWDRDRALIISGDLFPGSAAEDGALPGISKEDLLAQMQKAVDASAFSYKLNARPIFETGRSEGNWNIENPNYNAYPIVVQVTLDDSEELIYDSGGLLPNQHIAAAKLDKVLKAGTYSATATIHMYHPETQVEVGKTEAGLVITVLK